MEKTIKNLRKYIKRHGITVTDVAQSTNIPERTLYNWLGNHTKKPNRSMLNLFLMAFKRVYGFDL